MQNWVVIGETYLNYLRIIESRIPYSNYGVDKFKPFFGVLFEVGDLAYVTQISHPKPRHGTMKNSLDFYKIYIPDKNPALPDRFAGVVNLNYMFPVPNAVLEELEYAKIDQHRTFTSPAEKSKYIDLLQKQMAQINQMGLDVKAKRLYDLKRDKPEHSVSRRCLDFAGLEALAAQYLPQSKQGDKTL